MNQDLFFELIELLEAMVEGHDNQQDLLNQIANFERTYWRTNV
jgi:hypothetical protein